MAQHISKNRAANELYAQARAKAATLGDATKAMTFEEVEAIDKEVKSLTRRAQVLAEQTPDDEVERQGGEGDLVRVENRRFFARSVGCLLTCVQALVGKRSETASNSRSSIARRH
jgi:hypothetical protein